MTRSSLCGALSVAALSLLVAACGTEPDTSSPLGPQVTTFAVGDATDNVPEFGKIKVCKTGNVSGTFDFDQTLVGGGGPGGISADGRVIEAGDCVVVAEDAGGDDVGRYVTVTETNDENLVAVTCQRIDGPIGAGVISDCPVEFPNGGNRFLNSFHGFVVTFDNFEEPPPPSVCIGLTPGYWRNWDNHYTQEQFDALIGMLPAPYSGMDSDAIVDILSYGGRDALQKLEKFLVANLLTIALTGTDYPNPDGAGLDDNCTWIGYDGTLADAIALAFEYLDDPPNRGMINALKDILDAFANLE